MCAVSEAFGVDPKQYTHYLTSITPLPLPLSPLPSLPPRKRRESIVLLIHPSTHSITYAPLSFSFPTLRLLLSQPFSISLINGSSLHFLPPLSSSSILIIHLFRHTVIVSWKARARSYFISDLRKL